MQLRSQYIHQAHLYKSELHNPSKFESEAESKKTAELDQLQSTLIAPSMSVTVNYDGIWLLLLLYFSSFPSLVYNWFVLQWSSCRIWCQNMSAFTIFTI